MSIPPPSPPPTPPPISGSGNVTGPTGAVTAGNLAAFSGGTGTVIADSGILDTTVLVAGGALGTPSSGTLTNTSGLPVTGVSGLGSGVASALAVAVGTAGAPIVNGGALGTPSSGTLTNTAGLPIAGLSGLGSGVASGSGLITVRSYWQ